MHKVRQTILAFMIYALRFASVRAVIHLVFQLKVKFLLIIICQIR